VVISALAALVAMGSVDAAFAQESRPEALDQRAARRTGAARRELVDGDGAAEDRGRHADDRCE
jgi:hypothetical protein